MRSLLLNPLDRCYRSRLKNGLPRIASKKMWQVVEGIPADSKFIIFRICDIEFKRVCDSKRCLYSFCTSVASLLIIKFHAVNNKQAIK